MSKKFKIVLFSELVVNEADVEDLLSSVDAWGAAIIDRTYFTIQEHSGTFKNKPISVTGGAVVVEGSALWSITELAKSFLAKQKPMDKPPKGLEFLE